MPLLLFPRYRRRSGKPPCRRDQDGCSSFIIPHSPRIIISAALSPLHAPLRVAVKQSPRIIISAALSPPLSHGPPGGMIMVSFVSEGPMRHVLSALVQNVPGVLSHISGMLASRGYNIDSLAVGETEDPHLSRMTFVVVGDDNVLDQVRKQLEKIVTVVRVDDIGGADHVERDLMLIKVSTANGSTERNPRVDRYLPRPHRRRGARHGDDRNLRPGAENRGLYRNDAPLRDHRTGPHRTHCHGAREK